MAQIDFFIDDVLEKKLIEYLFSLDFEFIPSIDSEIENYNVVNSFEEFDLWSKKTRQFYLINKNFTTKPLVVKNFVRDEVTFFYISQRYGGPYIDFFLPATFNEDSTEISSGFIGIYSSYYGINDIQSVDILNSYYRKISNFIKKNTVKFSLKIKRTYWVSQSIIDLIEQGKAELVGVPSEDISILLGKDS